MRKAATASATVLSLSLALTGSFATGIACAEEGSAAPSLEASTPQGEGTMPEPTVGDQRSLDDDVPVADALPGLVPDVDSNISDVEASFPGTGGDAPQESGSQDSPAPDGLPGEVAGGESEDVLLPGGPSQSDDVIGVPDSETDESENETGMPGTEDPDAGEADEQGGQDSGKSSDHESGVSGSEVDGEAIQSEASQPTDAVTGSDREPTASLVTADGQPLDSVDSQVTFASTSYANRYGDGVWRGVAKGMGGNITVTVTVAGGHIVSLTVDRHNETQGIGTKAVEQLPSKIVQANGLSGVDAVTGATVTSKGIFTAVDQALIDSVKWGIVAGFTDVDLNAWYVDYVARAMQLGLMSGLTDAQGNSLYLFAPDQPLTRGQVATILFRYANPGDDSTTNADHYGQATSFSDVPAGIYCTSAVEWCRQQGIVTGYEDGPNKGLFLPEEPVTREQLATMVYRFATKIYGMSNQIGGAAMGSFNAMPDRGQVYDYAVAPMAWCFQEDIITGVNNLDGIPFLSPSGNATRAMAAKVFVVLAEDALN